MKLRVGQIYTINDETDKFEILDFSGNDVITSHNLLHKLTDNNTIQPINYKRFVEYTKRGIYILINTSLFPNSYGRLLNLFL